jgi:hypothetical protein
MINNKKNMTRNENFCSIKFDAVNHQYHTPDGRACPSVTQVLPELPEHLKYNQNFIDKTELGTRVHFATQVIDCGGAPLKPITLHVLNTKCLPDDPDVPFAKYQEQDVPYVNAWIKCRQQHKMDIRAVEKRVFSVKYDYAGAVDRVAVIEDALTIIDIKTVTELSPTVALQLAGYAIAYMEENGIKYPPDRVAVQLKPDGTFVWKKYQRNCFNYDSSVFLSKVVSAKWDLENLNKR